MSDVFAILARELPLLPSVEGAEKPLPADIQYLPPGENEILPAWFDGKENTAGKTIKVRASAATSTRLQRFLTAILSAFSEGKGPRPWLDENHQNARAVGFPTEFFWGGEDPKTGGVRLKVTWNSLGEELLRGRVYSFFSPQILVLENGEVGGALLNMGGLVNQPAFRTIQQISACAQNASAADTKTKTTTMPKTTEEHLADIAGRLAVLDTLNDRITKLETNSAQFATASALQAHDGKITKLETALAEQKADSNRKAAQAVVIAAVQAGRIPPQDKDTQKAWEDAIAADPAKADLLNKTQPNPAFAVAAAAGNRAAKEQKEEITGRARTANAWADLK